MFSSVLITTKSDLWMLQCKDGSLTFFLPALCTVFSKPTESSLSTGVRKPTTVQVASQWAHPQRKLNPKSPRSH